MIQNIQNPYLKIMHRENPIGTLFLFFPAIIALFVAANGSPSFLLIIVYCVGCLVARTAGCVFNDIVDRKLDAKVARTADRPMATGELSVAQGLLVFAGLVLAGVLLLIGFLPKTTYPLVIVCVILLAIYPFSKRFVKIPQIVLAIAYSMPILMAYASVEVNPFTSLSAWLLFFSNACWVMAYDTQYAVSDLNDDIKQGNIYSSAIYFGDKTNLFVLGFSLLYVIFLFILGAVNGYGYLFYLTICVNILIFIYQFFYVKEEEPETGIKAFYQHLYVGLLTCLAILFGLISAQHNNYVASQADYNALQTKYLALQKDYDQLKNPHKVALAPAVKPAETKPAVKPAETKPAVKPTEAKPAVKPAETKPVVKPAEVKPAAKPAEEKPAVKPAETKPAVKPAEVKPAEEKPVAKPAEVKPVAKPAEEKPVVKPAEVKPVVKPAEVKPAVKPAEVKPVAKPAEEKPVVKPAEVKPVAKPAEVKPVVKPAEEKPVAKPVEPKPATPAPAKPATPAPVSPAPAQPQIPVNPVIVPSTDPNQVPPVNPIINP